jgi:hypothetical protein
LSAISEGVMHMDETMAFLMPRGGGGTMLAAVNEHLAVAGLSITREDALMLAERRVESLAETERIEFGPPAVAAIAKAIASSPFLMQDNLVNVLERACPDYKGLHVNLYDLLLPYEDELVRAASRAGQT